MSDVYEKKYYSISIYLLTADIIKEYTGVILRSYNQFAKESRDLIIRNFIARSVVALNGLLQLWKVEDYHDCWLLYRAIIDRFFHLESLGQTDTFDKFDSWCFKRSYEYKKRCMSDPTLEGIFNSEQFFISEDETTRYSKLTKDSIDWRRPKAKEIASKINIEHLYYYGYDFASSYVHPTATEGQEDFTRLTNIDTGKFYDNQMTVINNSFLVNNSIIAAGLRFSRLEWNKVVYDFLNDLYLFLIGGPEKFISDMQIIRHLVNRNIALCRKPSYLSENEKGD